MDKVKATWKIHEKLWFFALLIFSGGFYGGYTYSLRGQVFANAQTANLVIMMLSLGKGKWGRAPLFPGSLHRLYGRCDFIGVYRAKA